MTAGTDGVRDPAPTMDATSQANARRGLPGLSVRPIVIPFSSFTPGRSSSLFARAFRRFGAALTSRRRSERCPNPRSDATSKPRRACRCCAATSSGCSLQRCRIRPDRDAWCLLRSLQRQPPTAHRAYQRRGISLHHCNQAAELKAVRAADERLAGYSFSAEQHVLRRLDKTFGAFLDRVKRGAKLGFRRLRAKTRVPGFVASGYKPDGWRSIGSISKSKTVGPTSISDDICNGTRES
jgi:hypothetical protein